MRPSDFSENYPNLSARMNKTLHIKVRYLPQHEGSMENKGIHIFRMGNPFCSDEADSGLGSEGESEDTSHPSVIRTDSGEEKEDSKPMAPLKGPSILHALGERERTRVSFERKGDSHGKVHALQRLKAKKWTAAEALCRFNLYKIHEEENPWVLLPSQRLPMFVVGSSQGRIHMFRVPLEMQQVTNSWIGEGDELSRYVLLSSSLHLSFPTQSFLLPCVYLKSSSSHQIA